MIPAGKDLDANWAKGISSIVFPEFVEKGSYAWLQNGDNSGGVITTRQGYHEVGAPDGPLPKGRGRGIFQFKDKNGTISLVIAIEGSIYACQYPFKTQFRFIKKYFTGNAPVTFCKAFVSNKIIPNPDPTLGPTVQAIDPYPVLVMQNGIEKALVWDGVTFSISSNSGDLPGIPIGTWMQWSGGRLWVASGPLLHASDFLIPTSFYEETAVAGGGALVFEDDITGMYKTPDQNSLLVGTDFDMSSVASGVYIRTDWANTPNFQKVFLPGIGVASGKSFCRQWGVIVWQDHGGLIALDAALNANISSQISYLDQGMMREKAFLSKDKSNIVVSSFGNDLVVAVPVGSRQNSKMWLLKQTPVDVAKPVIDASYRVPSWSSSWNGMNVVDMVSVVIDGQERLFALSQNEDQPSVWELFTGERQDRSRDIITKPPVIFETRVMGMSDDLKQFEYAELDLANIKGRAHVQVFVSGRKGGYHLIMDKRVVSSEGSINSTITSALKANTTQAAPIGGTNLLVDNTTGFLDGPATAYVNGYAFQYTSKTVTRFQGTNLPIAVPVRSQVVQPIFNFTPDSLFVETHATADARITDHILMVDSTAGFRPGPDTLIVNDHEITYTGIDRNSFTGVEFRISVHKGDAVKQFTPTQQQIENTTINSFSRQRRILSTENLESNQDIDCQAGGVESDHTDRIDRGFSLLVKWTGIMSLVGVRIFFSSYKNKPVGKLEQDEITSRSMTEEGCGQTGDLIEPDTITSGDLASQYSAVYLSKTEDVDYIAGVTTEEIIYGNQ